jgi:hypothetical protein
LGDFEILFSPRVEKSRFQKLFSSSHPKEVFEGGGAIKNPLILFLLDILDDKT